MEIGNGRNSPFSDPEYVHIWVPAVEYIQVYEEIVTGLRKYTAKYGSALESIGVDTWG